MTRQLPYHPRTLVERRIDLLLGFVAPLIWLLRLLGIPVWMPAKVVGLWFRPADAYARRSRHLRAILGRQEETLKVLGMEPWTMGDSPRERRILSAFLDAHAKVIRADDHVRMGRRFAAWAELDSASRRIRAVAFMLNSFAQQR